MKLSGSGVFALAAVAVAGWLAYEVWSKKKSIADAAGTVAAKLNPASNENVVITAVDSAVQKMTGVKDDTFAGWLWRVANPAQEATDNGISAPTGPNLPSAATGAAILSPAEVDALDAAQWEQSSYQNLPGAGRFAKRLN